MGSRAYATYVGSLRKKVWINVDDIILVGLRDYQDDKADVILKYTPDEARILKNEGHLPESAKLNEGDEGQGDEVEFVDVGGSDESDNEVAAQDRAYEISESSSEEEDSDAAELARDQADRETKPGAREKYGKASKGVKGK